MLAHHRPLKGRKLNPDVRILGSNGVSKRGLLAPLEPMLGHRWPPTGRKLNPDVRIPYVWVQME